MGKSSLKIGLLGLGTVGSGVPLLLKENKDKISNVTGMDVSISKCLVLDTASKKDFADEYGIELTTNYQDILDDDEIQVVVELIGGIEPAKTFILQALERGKHVVTANKDLLAQYGLTLVRTAQKHACDLYFEASVAGGIPILRTIANSLAADRITSIYGIVNGTTNYMLTKMTNDQLTYDEALAKAQKLGFAESDPTNDVDGIDAAYKMVILTQFSFGMSITIDDIVTKGIRGLKLEDIEMADTLGYAIKLIGSSESYDDSVAAEVGPVLIPKDHPLAGVQNEMNAVFIKSHGVGESMYYGPGAGAKPTATSVVSDIITIAKNLKMGTTGHVFNGFTSDVRLTKPEHIYAKYYFSLEVPDKHGVFLKLTESMTRTGVSFEQIVQEKVDDGRARIVIITHEMSRLQADEVKKTFAASEDITLNACYKVL
ncbi:homoserine dehydrogenase [Vagococcus acidifermentans]|uniref:Homoserine dehydrogenase n=1 Tax=Vagococcus acidifermentans TaxID=564710 RepID=A0A430AXU2_9ENTE|nr:homoserine dehydrogenase [Vagococcus acidifermentans]RSU12890.1 homoserine dehydrogenase [Vagococcus acidifermentans]